MSPPCQFERCRSTASADHISIYVYIYICIYLDIYSLNLDWRYKRVIIPASRGEHALVFVSMEKRLFQEISIKQSHPHQSFFKKTKTKCLWISFLFLAGVKNSYLQNSWQEILSRLLVSHHWQRNLNVKVSSLPTKRQPEFSARRSAKKEKVLLLYKMKQHSAHQDNHW